MPGWTPDPPNLASNKLAYIWLMHPAIPLTTMTVLVGQVRVAFGVPSMLLSQAMALKTVWPAVTHVGGGRRDSAPGTKNMGEARDEVGYVLHGKDR